MGRFVGWSRVFPFLATGLALFLGWALVQAKEPPDTRQSHWAWQPLKVVTPPELPESWKKPFSSWRNHPIDHFVAAGLERKGLRPSPPADPETQLRRLHLDLTGLPPTLEDRERFLRNPDEKAWVQEVDRLLESRAYAEKWARHWLDVARFAESQGFEYDRPRDQAWPYRDWVIDAFHKDLPWNDFVMAQIAGDLLPGAGAQGIAATGFLVAGPWDQAGNGSASRTVRERAREDEMEEMVGTTAQAFLGLTVHCARCHDHKFDPITLKEYHNFKAALAGVKLGVRSWLGPREKELRRRELEQRNAEIAQVEKELDQIREQALKGPGPSQVDEEYPPALAPLRWSFWGRQTPAGEMMGTAKIVEGDQPGLVLDGNKSHYRSLPIDRNLRAKTLEVWLRLANTNQQGGGVLSLETLDGTIFDSLVFGEKEKGVWLAGSESHARSQALSQFGCPPETESGSLIHLALTYAPDGSVRLFRNGKPVTRVHKPAPAPLPFEAGKFRVLVGMRHTGGGNPYFQGTILEARVYPFALSGDELSQSFQSGYRVTRRISVEKRLSGESLARWQALNARREALETQRNPLQNPDPQVFAAVSQNPGIQKVLVRGDIDRPEGDALPSGLEILKHASSHWGLNAGATDSERRLSLARWIAHPQNTLGHRVWINRIWLHHFGHGIIDTPSDFGLQGEQPTHPEMLDFLVVFFRESGLRTKPLHRLILTSQTYRQASQERAEALEKDSQTRWLWRFPPRRLDAESIRDSMLKLTGELRPATGGPGFRPFRMESFNSVFYRPLDYEEPDFLKRSIYRMVIRSARSPLMEAFDCPDPTVRTPKRVNTTTPIQALALMNDPFVQRRCQAFAARARSTNPDNQDKALEWMWLSAYGRTPRPKEKDLASRVAVQSGLETVAWALFNSSEFLDLR